MKETSFLILAALTALCTILATVTRSGRVSLARQVLSTEHLPEQKERPVRSEGPWPPPEKTILWIDSAGNLGFLWGDIVAVPPKSLGSKLTPPERCKESVRRNSEVNAWTLCMPTRELREFFEEDR